MCGGVGSYGVHCTKVRFGLAYIERWGLLWRTHSLTASLRYEFGDVRSSKFIIITGTDSYSILL